MENIRVSVIMTSYNGEKYISEQITSILNALGPADELIISDDGSSDSTIQIINNFVAKDGRVLFFEGPKHGLNKNIQFLLSKVRGDYIFVSDQDDVWHSDKVNVILKKFEDHPNVQVIHHDSDLIDGFKVKQGKTVYETMSFSTKLIKFFFKSHIFGSMMAMRKSFLLYDFVPPKNCYDAGIACFSMKTKSLMFIDDILMDYRRHSQNVSTFSRRSFRKIIPERIHLFFFILFRVLPKKKVKTMSKEA